MQHKISVDAMGGDFGPSVTIPASLKILKKYENISIVLVGIADEITKILKKKSDNSIFSFDGEQINKLINNQEIPTDATAETVLTTALEREKNTRDQHTYRKKL